MNSTATLADKPTASCIWNSFRNSGKRHLILTGGRGSGKTTLLGELFPTPVPGITTWAEPEKAVYLKENGTSDQARIGIYDPSASGNENKMIPDPDGFTSLGMGAIDRCIRDESEWITIDEIGYLECAHVEYCDAIRCLMSEKHLAATLRKQDVPFLLELRSREDVFLVDLDDPYGNIGCVIMASGMGKRFGSNKLMADFGGEPLIVQAIQATEGIFTRRVAVTRHKDVADFCRSCGVETVLHDFEYRSDTVRLGLELLRGGDFCMFCPGDQPLLRRETVVSLVLAARNDKDHIHRTACKDVPASPVLFPKWAFPELLSLPQGKGGGHVAKKYPHMVRLLNVEREYELRDVDTPEDLRYLMTISNES